MPGVPGAGAVMRITLCAVLCPIYRSKSSRRTQRLSAPQPSVSQFVVWYLAGYAVWMTLIRPLATYQTGQPQAQDIDAITAIYRHHVLNGTASFEIDPLSASDMFDRMTKLLAKNYPVLIAETAGHITGFAYAGPHEPRAAYNQTVEDSVYVDQAQHGIGIGRQLLTALIDAAATCGYHQMMAVIGDSANAASIGLHSALGFRHIGTAQEIGFKFGRRLDIVYMQRALHNAADAP